MSPLCCVLCGQEQPDEVWLACQSETNARKELAFSGDVETASPNKMYSTKDGLRQSCFRSRAIPLGGKRSGVRVDGASGVRPLN
jgi:hypothetical protein